MITSPVFLYLFTNVEDDGRAEHASCENWARAGECQRNPKFMSTSCSLSCEKLVVSQQQHCTDYESECSAWAEAGECERNRPFMTTSCRLSCGICCADRLNSCADLALQDWCQHARSFMRAHCATSCNECEILDVSPCANNFSACARWAATGACAAGGRVGRILASECPLACNQCTSSQTLRPLQARPEHKARTQAIPAIIYGTAWKGARTAESIVRAADLGFRAFDTACQPKHYNEPAVGEAVDALASRGIARHQLFLQTKFTPRL